MKRILKLSGAVLAAGIIFGVGQRIGQWLLPAPPIEVELCLPGSDGEDSDSAKCLILDATAGEMPAEAARMVMPPATRSL